MAAIKGTVAMGINYEMKTPVPVDNRTLAHSRNELIDASLWDYGTEFFLGLPVSVTGYDEEGNPVDVEGAGLYILSSLKGASVNLINNPSTAPEEQRRAALNCWTRFPSKEYVDALVKALGSVLRFIDVLEKASPTQTIYEAISAYRTTHTDYETRIGDVFIFGSKEYVCTKYSMSPAQETWVEFGDENLVITDINGYSGSVTLDGETTTDGNIRLYIDPSTGKITGTVYGYSKKMDNIGEGHENNVAIFDQSGYVKDSSVSISTTFSDSSTVVLTGNVIDANLNKKINRLTSPDASNHIAIFDASGAVQDSSVIIDNTKITDSSYTVPTGHAVYNELTALDSSKMDKVSGADVSNHIVILDPSGNSADSSIIIGNSAVIDSSYSVPTGHAIYLDLLPLIYAGL